MFELSARVPGSPDGLFFERLDTFMDKCLADIRAFSEREHRPFEETRQHVAEWHAKYLFKTPLTNKADVLTQDSPSKVLPVLFDTSRLLESLGEVTGVQSFVLAVDPNNPSDGGFLGGSLIGREFWRGMRGGGDPGAKAFKAYCHRDLDQSTPPSNNEQGSLPNRPPSIASSRSLKSDLYDHVRKALRTVSGVRNAEMKWTNPERLDQYGVRLVGWPPTIPAQNPSSLKANQNKELIHCLETGTMRFERINPTSHESNLDAGDGPTSSDHEEHEDFSWAYNADGVDPSLESAPQRPADPPYI